MRNYEYSARNRDGAVERGVMEAKSRTQVVEALQSKGLIVVKVEEKVSLMAALNEVNIGGVRVSGAAFDRDTVSASMKALLSALNRQAQLQGIKAA